VTTMNTELASRPFAAASSKDKNALIPVLRFTPGKRS
jgi:hypothetical protein